MKNARKEKRLRKQRTVAQSMLIILLTVTSLATDGFGAAPPSQFSEDFREQLSEFLPAELVEEINQYLTEVNAVTIPAQVVDAVEEVEPTPPPSVFGEEFRELLGNILPVGVIESLNNILAIPIPYVDAGTPPTETGLTQSPEELAEELLAAVRTQEALASPSIADAQKTATALSSLIPSTIPISTFTPSPTPLASPSPPPEIIWYPWSPTPTQIPNHKPSCSGFNYSSPQTIGILAIDLSSLCSDPDGDPWTITSVTQGANGSSTFTTPNIFYDPDDGFSGADNLTFTIEDNKGGTYTQAFDIIIQNWTPTANPDAATVAQDSGANLIDVLANDTDPGNDALTITNLVQPSNGAVALSAGNTTLTYTPNAGFTGADSFTYSAADPYGGISAPTTVSVTVTPATTAIVCDQANTAGCVINHIQFNGNLTTSIYVQPNEILQLGIGAQGWDTICPTCSYTFAFGIESTMLGCANPLTNSYISTGSYITASTTPGTYDIYANINENSCDYLNPSTSVAQVHVCAPVTAQVNNGNCYTGPSPSYPTNGWLANTTMWNEITAKNSDYGSLFYELTSPSWSCWIEASTMIIATQGDLANCVPYKYVAPPSITIYRPNSYNGGSLGDRSNTKALCASTLPSGYTNYQAFIGYSAADSIANMPSNYGVPTNLKIQSPNGTIIANNWADLLDGTIMVSLNAAGISATSWWSGAAGADGTHIDGVTNNCVDWTDNNADGQLGSLFATDSQWMVSSISACSPQDWTLLCIAYP